MCLNPLVLFEEPIKIEIEGQSKFCKNICINKNIPVYTAKDCTSGDCHVISCQCFKYSYNKTAVMLVLFASFCLFLKCCLYLRTRRPKQRRENIYALIK